MPLASVANEINRCLEVKLYYPALLVSLTIPEICAALALPKAEFVKKPHYVAFIDQYARDIGISGLECFRLRGGLVHRANLVGHPEFKYTHVLLTLPESAAGVNAVDIQSGDSKALCLDLPLFCQRMYRAAHNWYEDNKLDPLVVENMKDLISYRENGLPPFMEGLPIVGSGA